MFEYLDTEQLRFRLGLVYLILAIMSLTLFISAYSPVGMGAKWILVLLAFGLMGFELFKYVRSRKGISVASTSGQVNPSVESTKPPSE